MCGFLDSTRSTVGWSQAREEGCKGLNSTLSRVFGDHFSGGSFVGICRGYRVLVLHLVLVSSVGWLGGCTSESPESQQYKPGFAALPTTCADVVKPLETAVKAFAGDLYRSDIEFDWGDRIESPGRQALGCDDMTYSDPIPREPIHAGRPMSRSFRIVYRITTMPRPIDETTKSLSAEDVTTLHSAQPTKVPGIGEDAIMWFDEPKSAPVLVGLRFRIGNLDVNIGTSGRDWSGDAEPRPVDDSPKLREDLRVGAESLAKAVAQHAQSTLPTTVVTQSPSAPPTTTSAPPAVVWKHPVWNPCGISIPHIANAGLDPYSKEFHGDTWRAECKWQGAWFSVEVRSTSTPFDREVYDSDRYVQPTPLTVGGRRAVRLHPFGQPSHCIIAFDVARNPKSGMAGGTIMFDAWMNDYVRGKRPELCDELTRVADAVVADLPPR